MEKFSQFTWVSFIVLLSKISYFVNRSYAVYLKSLWLCFSNWYKISTGGRYFHFLADPFSFQAVAKESKKLCFRKFTIEPTKKIFDINRILKTDRSSHPANKHLQVVFTVIIFLHFSFSKRPSEILISIISDFFVLIVVAKYKKIL